MKQSSFKLNQARALDLIIKYRDGSFSFDLISSKPEGVNRGKIWYSLDSHDTNVLIDNPFSSNKVSGLNRDILAKTNKMSTAKTLFQSSVSLCFLLSGQLKFKTEGKTIHTFEQGYSYVDLEKGMRSIHEISSQVQSFDIHFSPEAFQNYYNQLKKAEIVKFPIEQYGYRANSNELKTFKTNAALLIILHQIQECPYAGSARISYLTSKVLELLIVYYDNINKHLQSNLNNNLKLNENDIEKIIFLKRKLSTLHEDRFQLNDLAKEIGMSRTDMQVKFKTYTGKTIIQYHREYILEGSINLLKTDMAIKNIAFECGYSSTAAFSKAFSKLFGFSPSVIKED